MKKKLCALILAMACVCSLGTTGASAAGISVVADNYIRGL